MAPLNEGKKLWWMLMILPDMLRRDQESGLACKGQNNGSILLLLDKVFSPVWCPLLTGRWWKDVVVLGERLKVRVVER